MSDLPISINNLDNTKRQSFRTCPRKFYWSFVRNLKTCYGSSALRYGSTWHAGVDAYYKHVKEFGWDKGADAITVSAQAMKKEWDEITNTSGQTFYNDYRTLGNAFLSFAKYLDYFFADEHTMKIIQTETPFKIPMAQQPNEIPGVPDFRVLFPRLAPFNFTGVIDGEIYLNDRYWILEHKTTSQPIATQAQRLHRSAQIIGYTWAATQRLEEPPEGAMIGLHHLSCYKSKKDNSYGEPKIDFLRSPQFFSARDLEQWMVSFFACANDLQEEYQRNLWPMCHDNCYQYGACAYIMLCEQNRHVEDTIIPETHFFVGEAWDPAKDIAVDGGA